MGIEARIKKLEEKLNTDPPPLLMGGVEVFQTDGEEVTLTEEDYFTILNQITEQLWGDRTELDHELIPKIKKAKSEIGTVAILRDGWLGGVKSGN